MAITPTDVQKQLQKLVSVSSSVAGLSKMVNDQGEKARKLAAASKGEFSDADYKSFQKACEAMEKGKSAMMKEVKVLVQESKNFDQMMSTLEKEMKKKR
jgi:hypothetical protein